MATFSFLSALVLLLVCFASSTDGQYNSPNIVTCETSADCCPSSSCMRPRGAPEDMKICLGRGDRPCPPCPTGQHYESGVCRRNAPTKNGPYYWVGIGDWGGESDSPYTEPGQVATAKGLANVSAQLGANFVLALGDNFYSDGIGTDDHNPRFQETFEDVYTAASLQVPWYVLAGNHDHRGNVTAQIAYTHDSNRWTFPDYYYAFSRTFSDGGRTLTMQFIMIDTVLLSGVTEDKPHTQPYGPDDHERANTQWEWIEGQLSSSTADYLFVAGHYPVWSICSHGPTSILVSKLKPMLEKYRVTAYLSGHDHCLEMLDEGKGVLYVVTGAADDCCYSPDHEHSVPAGSLKYHMDASTPHGLGGFTSFNATATGFTVVFYDENGTRLYTSPAVGPRQ